jgi:hypothetical protein
MERITIEKDVMASLREVAWLGFGASWDALLEGIQPTRAEIEGGRFTLEVEVFYPFCDGFGRKFYFYKGDNSLVRITEAEHTRLFQVQDALEKAEAKIIALKRR